MSFLTALSNFGPGAVQGYGNYQNIQQKALQIQQAQSQLDEYKKNIAAEAVAFANLGQNDPQNAPPPQPMAPAGQAPQPMAPGQPSVPAQPQIAPQPQPITPAPQAVLQPPQGSQPPNAPPLPQGGPPAPSPQGGGAPSPQASPGGIDPTDPMAGVKVVTQIAQEIKSRNPSIDPQTLLLATQRIIDMSKGMAPALRTGAQVVLQDMRDQVQTRGQDVRAATQERGQDVTARGQDVRAETAKRGQDIGLERTRIMAESAMGRARFIQGAIDKRFASGQGDKVKLAAMQDRVKTITAQLTASTRKLSMLKDATGQPLPADDPRVQAVNREIDTANKKLDILASKAEVEEPTALAGGGSAERGPAPAQLKGRDIWPSPDGKHWVYEDGTEAK